MASNKPLSLSTTVVGSFPYEYTPENMEKAFLDQVNAGVSYPSYPQLVDMIEQFLDPLVKTDSGLEKRGKEYYLKGELKIPDEPFALEYGEFVVNYLKDHPDIRDRIKGWKACLTGPFTLAGKIIVTEEHVGGKRPIVFQEPRAIMSREILNQLADMMAMIAERYSAMGATIISMDEPTLGIIVGRRKILYHDEQTIIDIINRAITPIERYSSVHVCGRISPKIRDILLNSDVKILDHEFQKSNNEGIFERSHFSDNDKYLAYGIIASSVDYIEGGTIDDYIEDEKVLEKRIADVIEQYGRENLIFKPDCGFGGLIHQFGSEMGAEIVRRKLSVLNKVLSKFREEI